MGYVYFIQAEWPQGQPIKVGYSANPASRARSMRTGYPFGRLIVLHAMPGTVRDERALHLRFARDRLRNEWFVASAEILAFIRGCRACDGMTFAETTAFIDLEREVFIEDWNEAILYNLEFGPRHERLRRLIEAGGCDEKIRSLKLDWALDGMIIDSAQAPLDDDVEFVAEESEVS